MNAYVTGASGFIGSHLVRRLVQQGHQVYAMVRKTSKLDGLRDTGAELVYADIRDKSSLETVFTQHPEIDTVFHLASLLTPVSVDDNVYWDVNYSGTKNVLDVCHTQDIKAFVQCSSVGVIGPLPEIPADEHSRCAPDSNYGKSKYEAEKLALYYQKHFGLPVTVVRPAWAYGPGDRRTYKFFRMVASGKFFIIGNGQTKLHPVYVDDIAQGMLLAAEQIEQARGEVFIIGGPQSVTLETLAKTIAQEAGTSILSYKVPAWIAKMGASVCEGLCKPLNIEPPVHHRRLDFFLRDQCFDISKIQTTLGFEPQIDVPTGVKQAVHWYQAHKWL